MIMKWIRKFFSEILSLPAIIIGIGLMLASSGLDGIYLSLFMPKSAWWLGLVLNTMADLADMKLAYEFGKLQRKKDKSKVRMSIILLAGEIVAVFYSWYFSYLQLLRVLRTVEPENYRTIAPIAAGFIPLLLFFLGIAEALNEINTDAFKRQDESIQESASIPAPPVQIPTSSVQEPEQLPRRRASRNEWRTIYPNLAEHLTSSDGDRVNDILYSHGFTRLPLSTARDWAKEAVAVKGNGHEKALSQAES